MPTIARLYGQALTSILSKKIDFVADDVRVALLNNTYVPNQDTNTFMSDVVGFELSGGNYSRKSLTGKSLTYGGDTNTVTYDAADVTFTNLTGTLRHAVFFVNTGSDNSSPLICWMDFGADIAAAAQDFKIVFPPQGLLQAVTP